MFIWDSFENQSIVIMRSMPKREKETQMFTTHKIFMKTYIGQQTNQQLQSKNE